MSVSGFKGSIGNPRRFGLRPGEHLATPCRGAPAPTPRRVEQPAAPVSFVP
jgi:hypothetical protein